MTDFPRTVQTSLGKSLRLGREIGKGGEGAVFDVDQNPDLALKLYWRDKAADRHHKVQAMVSAGWHKSNSLVAFPVDAVFAPNGAFIGFLMRKIGGHKPAHLLYSPASRRAEFASATVNFRFLIYAAINASNAVASVHSTGCVIGDVNHSGFLVSKKATITLIDSDSFQVGSNAQQFLCKVGTPEYTPPELQGQRFDQVRRSVNHDNFGLAVLIFQLLFMGRHPFTGRYSGKGDMPLERAISEYRFAYSLSGQSTGMTPPPNVPLLSDFPPYIAQAFEQAFGRAGSSGRPTAGDWVRHLKQLDTELQSCTADPAHHHVRGKPCPWCRMEQATPGFVAFVSTQQNDLPLNIDVDGLLAILRGISDPGAPPDIGTVVSRPSTKTSQQASLSISQINVMRAIGVASSVGGVFLMQASAPAVLFGAAMVAAGAISIFFVPKRFRERREVRKQAQLAWNGICDAWKRQRGHVGYKQARDGIDAAILQLRGLPEEERRGLAQLEHKKRERQISRHLERFRIVDHKIPMIGSGRRAVLTSFGIETAADITHQRLASIQGFGPALIGELLSWRTSQEQSFVYRPQEPLNPADVASLKAHIRRRYAEVHAKARSAISSLQSSVSATKEERRRLASAAQPAFERLCQAETEEKAGLGWGQEPARYASFVCIGLALITLLQPRTAPTVPKAPVASPAVAEPMTTAADARRDLARPPSVPPKSNNQERRDIVSPSPTRDHHQPATTGQPVRLTPPSAEIPGMGGPYVPAPPTRHATVEVPAPSITPIPSNIVEPSNPANGGPIEVPRLDLAQKTDALRVQQRLIELKFLSGAADGIWGTKSRKALSAFRASIGLGVDDAWDEATQKALLKNTMAGQMPVKNFVGGWTPELGKCGVKAGSAPLRITFQHAETDGGRCAFEKVQPLASVSWNIQARCTVNGVTHAANIILTREGPQLTWKSERGTTTYHACRD